MKCVLRCLCLPPNVSMRVISNLSNYCPEQNFLLVDPIMYDNYYEMKLFFCTRVTKENMLYC